ncbi:MAG TPA: hypothetical protein VLA98_03310, partial [Solirubrobacteraceae bacterium]|nr:hypothetical protein [Solirubrobacteraceae bacterium]
MTDPVARIAQTVLYEGYLLWPYRRSALKNRRRWTFGGVHPPAWSARHPDDPAVMRTQCLVEGDDPVVDVTVRFLHVVDRRVAEVTPRGPRFVDVLDAGGERHVAWEEATEREVVAPAGRGGAPIAVAAGRVREHVAGGAGLVERTWAALSGGVGVRREPAARGVHRLTVTIANTSPWDGEDRAAALRRSLVSTHAVLRARRGAFVSLMDPPDRLAGAAAACRNDGAYPVLVGDEPDRTTMLAAPIMLPDRPEIAPESPGDLFDATEIDGLLVLSVLGMSDDERREARAS